LVDFQTKNLARAGFSADANDWISDINPLICRGSRAAWAAATQTATAGKK